MLCGPFISQNNEQVQSGDIRFKDEKDEIHFLTYDQLFVSLLDYIYDSLEQRHRDKLEVIIVPSHADITHIFPVPQPPMPTDQFATTKFARTGKMPHLVANPGLFTLSDISVGVMNCDVMQSMCRNVVEKNTLTEAQRHAKLTQMGIGGLPTANQKEALAQKPPNKLEGVFRTMLEQRSFYPLYPNTQEVPIEWQQIEGLGFNAQPDVIFTPSDLKLCAKVSTYDYLTVLEHQWNDLCQPRQCCEGSAVWRKLCVDDHRAASSEGDDSRQHQRIGLHEECS